MATLYADSNGVILRYVANETMRSLFFNPVENPAFTLDFDETTNPNTALALDMHLAEHDLIGGVLHHNGQVVVIAPDGSEAAAKKIALGEKSALTSDKVIALVQQAESRRTQIVADRTTLAAATTLAQLRPILDRQLVAEDALLLVMEKLLKGVSRLV